MLTIEELKEKLRKRLMAFEGNATPADLADIIEEARELGMSDEQIARLVPEAERSINWDHIRAEKEKAAEIASLKAEQKKKRQEEIDAAPEYLDALISYCMADGVVEAEELRTIFSKAEALEQSIFALAGKIKNLLDRGKFRPYPNANLNADGLHEVLMSTNWYTEKARPQAAQSSMGPQAPEKQEPLSILAFHADKRQIRKGQYVTLGWRVSGKGRISISNLGTTEKLEGTQIVQPVATTSYVLTAGAQQQTIEIVVSAKRNKTLRIVLWIIGIIVALRILAAIASAVSDTASKREGEKTSDAVASTNTSTYRLTAGQAGAINLTDAEEAAIVTQMNAYLETQDEDNTSPTAIAAICDMYAYPMTAYFSKRSADREYVYNDALRYRRKYKPDHWALNAGETKMRKLSDGDFSIDLGGDFSYYIRKPQTGSGFRQRYVHNRYIMTTDYKIKAVWEVK